MRNIIGGIAGIFIRKRGSMSMHNMQVILDVSCRVNSGINLT